MKIANETIEIIEKQFALDCNLEEAKEIQPGKVFLSKSRVLPGARIVHKTDIFFRAILFMKLRIRIFIICRIWTLR